MKEFNSNAMFGQVITKEDLSKEGNIIFEGGTGTGKTFAILNNVDQYARENNLKVLFLCNRSKLIGDVLKDIKKYKSTNTDVNTYQFIEHCLMNNIPFNEDYDIIACDEIHHVGEIYNKYTDISFNWILQHRAKKIFMSATCKWLFNKLIKDNVVHTDNHYYIPKSYSYVEKIVFFSKSTDAFSIIKDKIENTDEKIIYFAQSLEKVIEMYNRYPEISTFFCSKHTNNKKALKLLEANEGRIAEETFEGRLLVSTVAMDVGVNLYDRGLKTIVCDIYDYSNLIQCLGRKRLFDENDTCTFYIHEFPKRELNRFRNTKILNELQLFINDREEFDKTCLSNRSFHNDYIFYDNTINDFRYNEYAYLKLLENEAFLDFMIYQTWWDDYGYEHIGTGYRRFILRKLGNPDVPIEFYDDYKKEVKVMKLEDYLSNIAGKPLHKDERNELIDVIGLKDARGRLQKSVSLLNAYLKENNIDYTILSKRTAIRDGNNKRKYITYWEVVEGVAN